MARASVRRPVAAGVVLSALLAVCSPPASPCRADSPGDSTVRKIIRSITGEGRPTVSQAGTHKMDEGTVAIPRSPRGSRAVVVLAESDRLEKLLKTVTSAALRRGVIVLAPAVTGPADKAAREAMGNLDTLLSWLEGKTKLKPEKLYVVGLGGGAPAACRLALRDPSRFSGLVLVSAKTPELTKPSLAGAGDLPVLVVHGADDKTCPVDNAKKTKKLLADAGLTVSLKALDGAGGLDDAGKHVQALLEWVAPAEKPKADEADDQKVDTVEACRAVFMKGRYASAVKAYRKLADDKQHRVSAAVGMAEALAMTGKYDEAIAALKKVADQADRRADWHLEMAGQLHTVGKYADALEHAEKAHELRPTWAPTIFAHGRILETLGRKKQAVEVYRSMSRTIEADEYRSDARSLVALGRIMDRYAVLTGQRAGEQSSNILHNYFQEAYMKADRKYWPANVAAGMFLLTKHRPKSAAQEFALAAKLNATLPDVCVGRAAVELGRWRFEQCLQHVSAALKISPRHADALLMKAVCLMQWRKFDQVPPVIESVLKVNPNHLEALSLMAAVHVRTRRPKKAEPFIRRVKAVDPNCAVLPNTIGQWLAAARQFGQAEKYYREAMALGPELAGPVTNLGKMYMQTGDEQKALATLEKAHKIDDFRSDVVNTLNLLKKMEKYSVRETEHFIVKVDGKHDAILLDQVAEYMEKIHTEIVDDFGYEPPVKTLIEFFPTHSDFSVRITGRGWIGTVGACTGRVIALAAPNTERSPLGNHNWATVLRHEYAHTITLAATQNRIPHWFTEACAVWQQPDKRNYRAVQMLVGATRHGRLFPVKELDWGFIRPKRAGDRSLAYAQSEWVLEYIIETAGYDTVAKMLRGFRDGKSQAEVFKEIVGVEEKQFDKGFRQWAKKTVKKWGFPSEPPPDYAKARKAAAGKPGDAKAQAELAVAAYYKRRMSEAEKAAKRALDADPDNTRAMAVLATVLAARKKYDEAVKHAARLEQLDPTTSFAPKVLAQCHIARRNWAEAIAALELLQQRQPLDSFSYEQLASIYTQLGQPEKALPNLIHLHRHTMRDTKYARQIAEIYRAMKLNEQALDYFEQVTHINPYQPNAYEAMAAIHRTDRHYHQAVAAIEKVALLQPDSADTWAKTAMMRYLAGRADRDGDMLIRAKAAAEKALRIDSDSRAKQVLERILATLEQLEEGT